MSEEYKCAMCNGVYLKGITDEEANAEALSLWGVDNAADRIGGDMDIICDDCFQKINPDKYPVQAAAARKELKVKR